ncbi:ArsR/SmtB family transcription factor [Desulfovibrio subterraneus]|jgi:ArsR family transcriptional regulator|uniref:ArsR family transcriptional regulator n=1 Tax=Desulfovibrio subterraneus TaxID=2718620 RepID=A0A7J0BG60_9BACT|nr:metalloregulator ArsR/SmtB family transcription factor [Desulfovibrio subterraneus]GFM32508.1 ArsR family transcriptional regulator [Desulfovibrio subterraneus]
MTTALPLIKALADETRLRLMHVLNRFELSVNELVSILEMGQSRVSRHLKILTGAGLLDSRRDGLWVFYSAPEEGPGREFIDALIPFINADHTLQADADMAAKIIEERARKTKQFFNSIAEDWDQLNRDVIGDFDLPGAIIGHMPRCKVALDLGCGTGTLLERMLEKALSVIGVDGSPRMLELAKRRLVEDADRVSLRIGELEHLPLRDGEADFAAINMVLHHLSHPGEALKEIRRVLRPGGLLALADFDRHDNEKMRSEYGDRWLGFDMTTLALKLTEAGFSLKSSKSHPVERGLSIHLIVAENSQQ